MNTGAAIRDLSIKRNLVHDLRITLIPGEQGNISEADLQGLSRALLVYAGNSIVSNLMRLSDKAKRNDKIGLIIHVDGMLSPTQSPSAASAVRRVEATVNATLDKMALPASVVRIFDWGTQSVDAVTLVSLTLGSFAARGFCSVSSGTLTDEVTFTNRSKRDHP